MLRIFIQVSHYLTNYIWCMCQTQSANDLHNAGASAFFDDADLSGYPLLQFFNMGNDPDCFALRLQIFQGGDGQVKRLVVQRTEAFINEKRADIGITASQIAQPKCQRQAHQKALATRQRHHRTHIVRLVGVHDVQFKVIAGPLDDECSKCLLTWVANNSAKPTGTALPSCRIASVHDP